MEFVLRREAPIGEAVHGVLLTSNTVVCQTLERRSVQIPVGRYEVVIYHSPHFDRDVPMLTGVPGRAFIEFHGGNTPGDSDGCVLCGLQRTNDGIRNCPPALDMVLRLIRLEAQRGRTSYVSVSGAKIS